MPAHSLYFQVSLSETMRSWNGEGKGMATPASTTADHGSATASAWLDLGLFEAGFHVLDDSRGGVISSGPEDRAARVAPGAARVEAGHRRRVGEPVGEAPGGVDLAHRTRRVVRDDEVARAGREAIADRKEVLGVVGGG